MDPRERLVVALDVPSLDEALRLGEQVAPHAGWLKVGLELFVRAGPEGVSKIGELGSVFLDLKLHDIPATVSRAVRAVRDLDVGLLTLHTGGGPQMVRAAVEAADGLKLLGVTVLTSLDAGGLASIGCSTALEDVVEKRACMAVAHGCAGVVASPREASRLRRVLGPGALIVTPGVRPKGSAEADQLRVATPSAAVSAGADLVVVGRPIRDASSPAVAASEIVAEIAACLESK